MASSSCGGRCNYDVFISFRGEDTRKIFVGHLYRALQQKAINTFIDSEGLSKGNKISELLEAIGNSRLSIVVLSQNYASSTWCLKELAKILDCMVTEKQIVVPIFYEVDPSDLRKINGKFAEAFAKHGENSNLDKEELECWRSALIRVADLSGWDSTKYEDDGRLIEEIVENTFKKLIHTSSNKANGLVGMDSHITEMNSRLCLQVNDVRVVGIWGMGGIGKTTIARAVFDEIAWQFEHSCFVDNVKEAFINKREVQMQEELISILLKEKVRSLGLNRGWNMIKERLGMKKVFVVLDDVETFSQIEALLGKPHAFGEGSRVIVTTRNKQSLSGVNETYKPAYLSNDEALELFVKYAFRTNQPNGDYDHLSRCAMEYAQGLPLALKVLGAFLDNKSVCEWEAVLMKLKKTPQIELQDVLRTSFDELDDSEKDIFLDIACLFRGWSKSSVTELLDSFGFFPHNGLRVLIDRALITISRFDQVDMHDLIQEMGREIVRLESTKEPGKRSRLWSSEDANCVLTQKTATDAVECLVLKLSNSKVDLCIDTEAFVRMTKLRLLIIYYSIPAAFNFTYCWPHKSICPVGGRKQLTRGDFEFLSHELRCLLWHGCPLKSLPSTYIPKNLVKLDMRGSHIQELWEGIKPLQNLKVITLSHSQYLVKIPDLTEAVNLEKLLLNDCSSLLEVHPSISALQNLDFLNLKRCKGLNNLPSSIHMKSLKTLDIIGCSNLQKFPEISQVMNKLTDLYLDGTAIKELPSSISNLTGLVTLDLSGCREFKSLPGSIHMKSLKTLNLSGCSNVDKFPEIPEVMTELKEVYLDETAIKELPSSIERLMGIKILSMRNCKSIEFLPDSICNLADLTHLNLSGCSVLHNLPEKLGDLESLQVLDVSYSGINRLPFPILYVGDTLSCIGCKEMTAPLSALPSSMEEFWSYSVLLHLDLSDCSLSELSDGIADLSSLKTLKLCRNNLESLPVTINRLGCLTHLELEACKRLKSIPELSSSINYIDAHNCIALETVSKPKPQYQTDHFFTFSNCLQLVQTNLFTDIVERHSHLQGSRSYLGPLQLNMSLPGSEVPDWFTHQSRGVSVSAQLPPNWYDSKFLGFAICAVLKCQGINYHTDTLSAACLCIFNGNSGECSFSFDMLDSVFRINRNFRSDHMFLGYVSWSDHKVLIEGGKLAHEAYNEATFQIVLSEFVNTKLRVRSCGVRLVYANPDEMLNLNMPQPQVHVDKNKNRKRRRQSIWRWGDIGFGQPRWCQIHKMMAKKRKI